MISFRVKGIEQVRTKTGMAAKEFRKRASRALKTEGDAIMKDAKANYVPVDSHDLRNSGVVSDVYWAAKYLMVRLSFGDPKTVKYAVAVHEHPSPSSPPSWRGKGVASATGHGKPTPGVVTFHPAGHGPKYLEKPFRLAKRGMAGRLRARILGDGK